MNYIISIIVSLFIAFMIFIYGFKIGKMTVEKINNDKVVEVTSKSKEETQKLKNEVSELRNKLREKKNEECTFILSYPVKQRCLSN